MGSARRRRLSAVGGFGLTVVALVLTGCAFHETGRGTPTPTDGGGADSGAGPGAIGGATGRTDARGGIVDGGTGGANHAPVCPAACATGQVCLNGTCQADPCLAAT